MLSPFHFVRFFGQNMEKSVGNQIARAISSDGHSLKGGNTAYVLDCFCVIFQHEQWCIVSICYLGPNCNFIKSRKKNHEISNTVKGGKSVSRARESHHLYPSVFFIQIAFVQDIKKLRVESSSTIWYPFPLAEYIFPASHHHLQPLIII